MAASLGINYLFERKPLKLFLINGGYFTLQFTLYGLVAMTGALWVSLIRRPLWVEQERRLELATSPE